MTYFNMFLMFIFSFFGITEAKGNQKKKIIISICILAFFILLALLMLFYSALQKHFYNAGYLDGYNSVIESAKAAVSLML